MKLLLIIMSSILLLSSCTQYIYEVEITPCAQIQNLPENLTGSKLVWGFTYTGTKDPYIEGKNVYMKNINGKENNWSDICDFSYTRNPIE